MPTLTEILEVFVYKQLLHQFNLAIPDKKKWTDEKVEELRLSILSWIEKEVLPKEIEQRVMATDFRFRNTTPYYIQGFNSCLAAIKERLKNEKEGL